MYNFVVFWSNSDFYRVSISDILKDEDVKVYFTSYDNISSLCRFFYKIHYSKKINKLVNLPFKKIWNKVYFKNNFDNNKPICFIFTIKYISLKTGNYFNYLRKHYKNCKLIIYLRDTVNSYNKTYQNFDVEYLKKTFDLVLTYNKSDANIYNITYYPYIASKIEIRENFDIPESDIFFVGAAKDRLKKIHEAYNFFTAKGLKCMFFINGVEKSKQIKQDGLIYNQKLEYKMVLKYIKRSKCILEITQTDAQGFTFRTTEALMYNKALITDTQVITETKFYNPNYVYFFKGIDEIDVNMLKKNMSKVDFNYKNEYSPQVFLKIIDEYFIKK